LDVERGVLQPEQGEATPERFAEFPYGMDFLRDPAFRIQQAVEQLSHFLTVPQQFLARRKRRSTISG
jgi:hypothetical protein